jgi:thiosulfate/3-mercaptopyruvate sulfurtransferase
MSFSDQGYLVETDWLEDHLYDPDLRVLDVSGSWTGHLENSAGNDYAAGHLPSAVFFEIASANGELSQPGGPFPWTWPTPEHFASVMDKYGITNSSRVVLVARTPRPHRDSGTMWCTRAWWLMHHFGVDCAILRGGVEKWIAEGRPLSIDVPSWEPTSGFVVSPNWRRGLATKEDVLAALEAGTTAVVYAGPEAVFNGTANVAGRPGWGSRNGHITGSSNLPMQEVLEGETALFKDDASMRSRLREAGLLERERVITYCGGGIAATVDAFALIRCGHPTVTVYDGSLTEWASDPNLPMTDPARDPAR